MGCCGNVEGQYFWPRNEEQRQIAANAVLNINLDTDKLTFVKIAEWEESRTERQNSYLWGWVYANIAQQLNDSGQGIPLKNGEMMDWDKDTLHEVFAGKYLALPPIETVRSEIPRRKSTTKLTVKEFNKYLSDIERACGSWWQISIPTPTRGVWYEYYKSLGFGNV